MVVGEVALRGERKLFWSEVEQLGQVDPIHSAFLRVSNSNLKHLKFSTCPCGTAIHTDNPFNYGNHFFEFLCRPKIVCDGALQSLLWLLDSPPWHPPARSASTNPPRSPI